MKILGFIVVLIFQALLIPLLPLPAKILLDRIQDLQLPNNPIVAEQGSGIAFFNTIATPTLIWIVPFLTILVGIGLALATAAETYIAALINWRLFEKMRTRFNRMVFSRELSFLESWKKVELMGRVAIDIEKMQVFFGGAFAILFRAIPTIVLTVAAMFWTNAVVASAFIAIFPILYWLVFKLSKPLKARNRKMRETASDLQASLLGYYSIFSIVKSLRAEKHVQGCLERDNNKFIAAFFAAESFSGLFNSSLVFVKALTRATILLMGCQFVISGRLSLGDFFLFFAYLETIIHPIDEISRFNTKWSRTLASVDRLVEFSKKMEPHQEKSGFQRATEPLPSLCFEGVWFGYGNHSQEVFKNVNLSLHGPQLVACVGSSGCGKSTFLSLINRLFLPSRGRVLVCGLETSKWDIDALRSSVRLIGQQSLIVSGSVMENLNLSGYKLSVEQAQKMLDAVGGLEFVSHLPLGLETPIGDGGQGLSGGQIRRLCLARGFSSPTANIYLFDEPTSGLDPETAKKVLSSLRVLSQKALVIFSTHRHDETMFADQKLIFKEGIDPFLVNQSDSVLSLSEAPSGLGVL